MTWKETLLQKISEFKEQNLGKEPNIIFNPTLTEDELKETHKHLLENDSLLLQVDQIAYSHMKAENDQRWKDTVLGLRSTNFTIFGIIAVKAIGIPNDTLAYVTPNSFIVIKDKAK